MVERRAVLRFPCHRGQAAAAIERPRAYAGHAVRDGHRGQTAAVIERLRADAGHTVRDGHRCQAAAAFKRRRADAGHAVRDGHRGQAAAAIVFASRLLSAFCALNGRKVIPRIL